MKPWTAWLARLGLAGSCLVWAGCGGSDVPDPDSDSKAATEATPAPGGAAPPPVAVAEEAPAPSPAVAAASPKGKSAPEVAAKGEEGSAAGEGEVKSATKPEATSTTAEMLALASGPAAAPAGDKPAEGEAAAAAPPGGGPAGYPGAPGAGAGSMAMGMRPPGGVPGGMPGAPGSAAGGMPAGYPGAPGGGAAAGPGAMMPGMARMPGAPGGMPGAPGAMLGAQGGGGDLNAPADFKSPAGAVTAFLNALRAKDPDRLDEATALRAGQDTETGNLYRKMFVAVHEHSLSSEDFDELAKKFEGMSIVGSNQAKSTGRLGIIVGKTQDGAQVTRTLTVRLEKAGWKVVDISGQHKFEKPFVIRGGGMRGGGRRR